MQIKTLFENYQYAALMQTQMEFKLKELQESLRDAEALVATAQTEILSYMRKNGVINEEVMLENKLYKIKRNAGKLSIDVPDLDAVPMEFVRERVVKTPDKIKIKAHLKGNKVNWASEKLGDETITYELVSLQNEDGSLIKARG